MFLKYVVETSNEGGVPVFGMIHGVIFIAYVIMCFVARYVFRWSNRTMLLALGASIPPFFTYLFEVKADDKGLLAQPVGATSAP